MKIDFKEEVLKRKDALISDLQTLLRINSELTMYKPKTDAPFGPGNKEALDWFLDLGKKDGFNVLNVDGYAGHIEYGDPNLEYVAMLGHLDVVPAGVGWSSPPYAAEIVDNKIIARGAEDDKGPTMAAYYALKILKELEVPLSKRVKLILGVDEESGFRCMKHYFEQIPQEPVSGFVPDADFPLIYGEKGITRTLIEGNLDDERILSICGGSKDNMVSETAYIILKGKGFKQAWLKYLADNKLSGEAAEDQDSILSVNGKSAHGSVPDEGISAINLLFKGLITIGFKSKIVDFVEKYLLDDNYGVKFGIDHTDEQMGRLTNNFGVIQTEHGHFVMNLNIRFPKGIDYYNQIIPAIKKAVDEFGYEVKVASYSDYLYQDPNSPLIKTLLSVYRKYTNDLTEPYCIGGGTYARACPNVVAFGPQFPGHPSFIHQVDESIDINDLLDATAIYAEALYELAK